MSKRILCLQVKEEGAEGGDMIPYPEEVKMNHIKGVLKLNKKKRGRVTILSDKGRQEYRCIDKDRKDVSFLDLVKGDNK